MQSHSLIPISIISLYGFRENWEVRCCQNKESYDQRDHVNGGMTTILPYSSL